MTKEEGFRLMAHAFGVLSFVNACIYGYAGLFDLHVVSWAALVLGIVTFCATVWCVLFYYALKLEREGKLDG